jgi:hypothetical protein
MESQQVSRAVAALANGERAHDNSSQRFGKHHRRDYTKHKQCDFNVSSA